MITILCVGKIKESYLCEMINDYSKRIKKYHKLEIVELKDSHKKEEGVLLLKHIQKHSFVVTLELDGEQLSSPEFAKQMDEWLMYYANITFIIGASEGLDEIVSNRANKKISFGKNTFPHGLFRGILLEQIYRGFKINNNETYHK